MTRRPPCIPANEQADAADDTTYARRASTSSSVRQHYSPFIVQYYISGDLNKLYAPGCVSPDKTVPRDKRKRTDENGWPNKRRQQEPPSSDGEGDSEHHETVRGRPASPFRPADRQPDTTSRDRLMNHSNSMFGVDDGNLTDQQFIMAVASHRREPMSAEVLSTLRRLISDMKAIETEEHKSGIDGPRRVTFDRSDAFSEKGGQYNEGYAGPIEGRHGQWEFSSYGMGFRENACSAEALAKLNYGSQGKFSDVKFPTPQQLYESGIPWTRNTRNLVWVPDDEREKLMGKRLPEDSTYRYRLSETEEAQNVGSERGKKTAETGKRRGGGGGKRGSVALPGSSRGANGSRSHQGGEGARYSRSEIGGSGGFGATDGLEGQEDAVLAAQTVTSANGDEATAGADQQLPSSANHGLNPASQSGSRSHAGEATGQTKTRPGYYYADEPPKNPIDEGVKDKKRRSTQPIRWADEMNTNGYRQDNQKGRASSVSSSVGEAAAGRQRTGFAPQASSTVQGKRTMTMPRRTPAAEPRPRPRLSLAGFPEDNASLVEDEEEDEGEKKDKDGDDDGETPRHGSISSTSSKAVVAAQQAGRSGRAPSTHSTHTSGSAQGTTAVKPNPQLREALKTKTKAEITGQIDQTHHAETQHDPSDSDQQIYQTVMNYIDATRRKHGSERDISAHHVKDGLMRSEYARSMPVHYRPDLIERYLHRMAERGLLKLTRDKTQGMLLVSKEAA